MAPLTVEIWSDIVCPWCYIGKRRFAAALAEFPHDVEYTWRSFELAGPEGLEYHFDTARGGNSFDAHRLLHLAAAHGKQDEAKERLILEKACE
jgi:predicted DsbA family dithiol-disulfide isomerase